MPDTALVITRSAVWRMLVKAAVATSPGAMVNGPAGPEVWVHPTWASSVTVQFTPAGMAITWVDWPVPPAVVMVRVTSQAVPSQATLKLNVPSPPTVVLVMISAPVWRVLVNETFSVASLTGCTLCEPLWAQPGAGASVTVQLVPNGMSDGVSPLPEPVMVRVFG